MVVNDHVKVRTKMPQRKLLSFTGHLKGEIIDKKKKYDWIKILETISSFLVARPMVPRNSFDVIYSYKHLFIFFMDLNEKACSPFYWVNFHVWEMNKNLM